MKNQLLGKLESAAQRLDRFLDTFPGVLGNHETMLLHAADDIARAMDLLRDMD